MKSEARTAIKRVLESLGKEDAKERLAEAASVLDKAAKKNLFHPRTIARRKSQLAKKVNEAAPAESS
jgi:small subunit ribosomal protein S20